MIALAAAGTGYALVIGPLAQPADDQPLPAPVQAAGLPKVFEEVASDHLADADWTQQAKWQLRRGASTIFLYDRIEPDPDDGRRVRLLPFAMLHRDPTDPDRPPHVVRCAAARLEFENDCTALLHGGDPGRIVGGSLEGDVIIRGPQNLEMVGHNFELTDESLYSDFPVRFSFGSLDQPLESDSDDPQPPVRIDGRADKMQVAFHVAPSPDDSLLSQDLPRIGGFREIWLRRNVELTIRRGADPDDPESQPEAVSLASDGRLEYLVDERVLRIEDNVRLAHPGQQELAQWPRDGVMPVDGISTGDRLENCDRISLVLGNKDVADASAEPRTYGNLSLDLQAIGVRATGQPLRIRATDSGTLAEARELTYDIAARTVALLGAAPVTSPEDGEPETDATFDVRLRQPGREMYCRQIVATLDDANRLAQTQAAGGGVFRVLEDDSNAEQIRAEWHDGLLLVPQADGSQQLTVQGAVQLREYAREITIGAEKLTADIAGDRVVGRALPGKGRGLATTPGSARPTGSSSPGGLERLKAIRAEGTGGSPVTLLSPRVQVRTESLQATIVPGTLGSLGDEGGAESAASLFAGQSEDSAASDDDVRPVVAVADQILVALVAEGERVDLRSLQAVGRVKIMQAGDAAADPSDPRAAVAGDLVVSGESAAVLSQGGSRQVLTLAGTPARIEMGPMRFRSPQLTVDRIAGRVSSPGGSATIPVRTAIAGESSQKPSDEDDNSDSATDARPLNVDWSERMVFDGRTIELHRGVKARQGETEVRCGLLTIELNRALDLTAAKLDTEGLDYERVTCRDDVRLTGKEWHQTELLTLRKARAGEIVFDRASGEMTADGPGELLQWSRDRHAVLAPAPQAAANTSRSADEGRWRFVRLTFDGRAVGHADREWIRLDRKIELLHTYVDRPLQSATPDEVFDAATVPTEAFYLKCDRLSANLTDYARDATPTQSGGSPLGGRAVQVQTIGHVQLEGRQFQAESDRLTFDQSTGDFFLHSEGDRHATVWIQHRPGGGWDSAEADTIRLNPEKKVFKADGAEGFWTAW